MKIWQMHSIIFQICKSNQIKRNYKRTSATMATKQVCWPHSHKPQEDSCQTSFLVKYRTFSGKTCGNQAFLWKSRGICPLLWLSALSFPVCCLKMPFPAVLLPPSATGAVPSWRVPPGSRAVSLPTLLQRHSCWMSAAPKIQKPPTERHTLNCQASSQREHHGVKYSAAIWHFYSPVLNFWAFIDQLMREKEQFGREKE